MATVASRKVMAALVLMGIGAGLAVGLGKQASADPPDDKEKTHDDKAAPKDEPRGESYPISELKLAYYKDNKGNPAIEKVREEEVELTVVDGGYAMPNAGDKRVKVKLKDIGKGAIKKIYTSGIEAVYGRIVGALNELGLLGVFVVVDSKDIDAQEKDVRGQRTDLTIIIVTSVVTEVDTVEPTADGAFDPKNEKNAERDALVRKNSPIKPASEGGPDLLRKDVLDKYVKAVGKKEGITVDVAISGGKDPGTVVLTYSVNRNRVAPAATESASRPAK